MSSWGGGGGGGRGRYRTFNRGLECGRVCAPLVNSGPLVWFDPVPKVCAVQDDEEHFLPRKGNIQMCACHDSQLEPSFTYILFIGIHTLCSSVTRGYGEHCSLTTDAGSLQALFGLYPLVDLVCELDVRRVEVGSPRKAMRHRQHRLDDDACLVEQADPAALRESELAFLLRSLIKHSPPPPPCVVLVLPLRFLMLMNRRDFATRCKTGHSFTTQAVISAQTL